MNLISTDGASMSLIDEVQIFFTFWGVLGDDSTVGPFIFLVYSVAFVLGCSKNIWKATSYKIIALGLLLLIPLFFLVGFYFISRPPA